MGTTALANSENFQKVTHLWLQNNSVKEDGVYNLVMSEFFVNLVHLDLS